MNYAILILRAEKFKHESYLNDNHYKVDNEACKQTIKDIDEALMRLGFVEIEKEIHNQN